MLLIEPTMAYDREIQAFRQDFADHGDMDGSGNLRRFERTNDNTFVYKKVLSEFLTEAEVVSGDDFQGFSRGCKFSHMIHSGDSFRVKWH